MALSPTVANKLNKDFESALIVKINFNGLTLGLTEAAFDISYNGTDYLANGILLGTSNYKETAEVKVNNLTLLLSSVDQTITSLLLQNNQIGREVFIDRIIYDPDNRTNILAAEEIAIGEISSFSNGSTKEGSVMSVTISSLFSDWQRKSGRSTTRASHESSFPGQLGMEYANAVDDNLRWGGE